MSRKITRYCSLENRKGKQVYAYFQEGKKTAKVLCDVVDSHGEVQLKPANDGERSKMRKCITYESFNVHPDWPSTAKWHCDLLKSCSAVGHTKKTTIKAPVVDGFKAIEIGKEYTCDCKCCDHVCKGPWMIVKTANCRGRTHDSYYLVHDNAKTLNGGNDKAAKRFGFKHGWWLGDVGEEFEHTVEIIETSTETVKDTPSSYQGITIGVEQTATLEVYEGSLPKTQAIVTDSWKLIEDNGDVFLLTNNARLDGSKPNSNDLQGYKYSWWLDAADDTRGYYRLYVKDAVAEPVELPDVGAAVQVTPKDPLVRIADALDRIATALEK